MLSKVVVFFDVFAIRLKNKQKNAKCTKVLVLVIIRNTCLVQFLPPKKNLQILLCFLWKPCGTQCIAYICISSPTADCKNILGWWLQEVDPGSAAEACWIPSSSYSSAPKEEKKNRQCFNAKFMEKSLLLFSGNASCLRGEADSIRADRLQRALLAWVVHSLGALILALWKHAVPLDIVYFTCGVASCLFCVDEMCRWLGCARCLQS